MRDAIVLGFVLFMMVYAFRNWYAALCLLIAFTSLQDYPNLPNPFGARGITPWSVILAAVTVSFLGTHVATRQGLRLPRGLVLVMLVYFAVEGFALARLCMNVDEFRVRAAWVVPYYATYNVTAVLVDFAYVPLRYMLLAFMLLVGANTQRRLIMGLWSVIAAVLMFALLVDKEIPLNALIEGGMKFRHRIQNWTQRNPNDLARDFAAAFWMIAVFFLAGVGPKWMRWMAACFAPPIALALGHTQSRGGYLGFLACGSCLAFVSRSWKIALVLVAAVAGVILFSPGIVTRSLQGVDQSGIGDYDMDSVTAGRDVIWPAAISAIEESPLIGYGMHGYVISRAVEGSMRGGGLEKHPHNGYLESLLDHGVLLTPGRLAPYIYVWWVGYVLIRRRHDRWLKVFGAVGVAYVTVALMMGLTGQHYGLSENLVNFWCITALVARAASFPESAHVTDPAFRSSWWDRPADPAAWPSAQPALLHTTGRRLL